MLTISSASSPVEPVGCQRLLQVFGAPAPPSLLVDKSEPSGIQPPPRPTSNADLLSGLASVLSLIEVSDRGGFVDRKWRDCHGGKTAREAWLVTNFSLHHQLLNTGLALGSGLSQSLPGGI